MLRGVMMVCDPNTLISLKSMNRHFFTAAVLALMPAAHGAAPVTEAQFSEIQLALAPASTEIWRTIPWKTSLLDAQRRAASEEKLIFIWAMDGHPLGCT
jgi:hypothetical protein